MLLQGGGPSSTPVVAALVEGMQLLVLQVQSHEDLVDSPKLFVRTDPPPRSSRPDDAFFFTLTPVRTATTRLLPLAHLAPRTAHQSSSLTPPPLAVFSR